MIISKDFKNNINKINATLRIGKSFDVIERIINIGGKETHLYYIDGFIKDDIMQFILTGFFKITPDFMNNLKTPQDFIQTSLPYVEVSQQEDISTLSFQVLSGQTAMIVDGYDKAIMIDIRTYPSRTTQEPEKEKVLRGSRDGLVETIVFNTALIRRRIRDSRLTFEMLSIGKTSKTDVVIAYMDNNINAENLKLIKDKISKTEAILSLTMGEQSLVEVLTQSNWYNPFPKVRYTERPDIAAAHIIEGKIVLLVDNCPSAIIIPTSFFDFLQDVEDYYLPPFTGNFLKVSRNLTLLFTVLLSPIYMLIIGNSYILPPQLKFLLPTASYSIPLLFQFLILEFAINGLKLASLNTPQSLGISVSVVGALMLSDLAVNTGIFIPQTILLMAIIALGSLSQPSIEFTYALKFVRIFILILTTFLGNWGFLLGLISTFILIATNKTITSEPYLYPLIPFNWKELKTLLFRTRIKVKLTNQEKNKR